MPHIIVLLGLRPKQSKSNVFIRLRTKTKKTLKQSDPVWQPCTKEGQCFLGDIFTGLDKEEKKANKITQSTCLD